MYIVTYVEHKQKVHTYIERERSHRVDRKREIMGKKENENENL
jgi:hypothetical protein